MKARIVCPHCKAQGRLIRLTETDGDRLRCRHCNKSYTREEIAVIYENAARAFAEAAAKVRKQPMKEQRATQDSFLHSPFCLLGKGRCEKRILPIRGSSVTLYTCSGLCTLNGMR